MEYHVLSDGWIKIPSADFPFGNKPEGGGRLLLGLNQLFVRINGKNVLIDTGLGDKLDFRDLGLLDYQRPRRLIQELAAIGIEPEDIDIVILTHLHYDHSGGATRIIGGSELAPTFTNSLYYVQRREVEYAYKPDPERATDYNLPDFDILIESGLLRLVEGEETILTGLKVHLAPGHTPGHQVITVQDGKTSLFFPGDLIPVKEYAGSNYVTAYDMDREVLLKQRSIWSPLVEEDSWHCVFSHAVDKQSVSLK